MPRRTTGKSPDNAQEKARIDAQKELRKTPERAQTDARKEPEGLPGKSPEGRPGRSPEERQKSPEPQS